MEFNHKPVLLDECIEYLNINPQGIYIDGTTGGAGHSMEIYKRLDEQGTMICIDQDDFALETAEKRLSEIQSKTKVILAKSNFKDMHEVCRQYQISGVDGILLDLGVSSHQLDEGERGFSYQKDAPLDMRMNRQSSLTAAQIVNVYSKEQLTSIIRDFGEEKWASRIADFIVKARLTKTIDTTCELVDIIKAAIPSAARREGPHPAKRTFQAIRIAVNDELGVLSKVVGEAVKLLNPGGRLCIITFHSLEDRIVKTKYNTYDNPCTCPSGFPVCVCGAVKTAKVITKKPIIPGEEELNGNPRSRSSKLRVLEKL